MKFRSPFAYDVKAASDEAATVPVGESLTVQSHSEDADINVIVKRFGLTGTMPVNHRVPEYGDYSQVGSYADALAVVRAADSHFMEMPAEVRSRFQNSPQIFLDFCNDPANMQEMVKLGLAVAREVPRETGAAESGDASK